MTPFQVYAIIILSVSLFIAKSLLFLHINFQRNHNFFHPTSSDDEVEWKDSYIIFILYSRFFTWLLWLWDAVFLLKYTLLETFAVNLKIICCCKFYSEKPQIHFTITMKCHNFQVIPLMCIVAHTASNTLRALNGML